MDGFDAFGTLILFLSLLLISFSNGEKTSHRDEEVDDYWTDG